MEASLTCAVCLGVFREPVTLPSCSHNFCKSCVLECASPLVWTAAQPRADLHTTVTCPLCRRVSNLAGGLAALPVNTTLAEVVRLIPQSKARERPGACGGNQDCGVSGKEPCVEHPELRLELFCKNCELACCGKCVSLRHQGIFHSVNLLDMVFQEEKLMFFNNLKTLRELHGKLTKEISEAENSAESILKANEDAVMSAFDEVQKALDLKKQQLLDLVKQQQSTSIKRFEVQKVTKTHNKTTVESLLSACETVVDDYEPRSFLQVACGLNKRMKSNLELMQFCGDHGEEVLRFEPQCVDVQAVLDAVSALKITSPSNDVHKQNGSFSFRSVSRSWNNAVITNKKYSPFQDQELTYLQGQMQKMSIRFVCITKMPEYQHLSYEELRLKYYEPSVLQEKEAVSAPERLRPFVCNNVNNFTFNMSLTNGVTFTGLKRQETFDMDCTAYGKDVFKDKSTKTDSGKMGQKDSHIACAQKKDNPVKTHDFPSTSSGGLTTNLSSDVKGCKTPKLCDATSSKALFPNFCFGKSDIVIVQRPARNEKLYKKLRSTASLAKSAGSVVTVTAVADRSTNVFSNGVGNAEENMSVNSASSEEFYDASSTINPAAEETCEQRSRPNSTEGDESSTLPRSPH
ncbi:putative tripartite motif-containing protein 61 isoform X1 [Bufo bufo]|uniref:putative tripartite motif-containing protein 61 isoform X1 n=1 Tax=Bufo bufo TaxID=8384 RepID=UPI001ABDD5DA|nr:putative tripartite motif-containing protein 61 isoform X1 [Bufo bufo]